MNILRASHLGMCFGVRNAINLALDQARQAPIVTLGPLVHNDTVLAMLRARGVESVERTRPGLDGVSPSPLQRVMATAHGASNRAMNRLRGAGFEVIEATCPLVRRVHHSVSLLVSHGYHPVVVGKRDHSEVRGIVEDLDEFDVILTDRDVQELRERPRYGVVAQTTQPVERVRHLVGLIEQRFPMSEVRFVDTVCHPTKLRQLAAEGLARKCDVVIVIGGADSNNTRELLMTCRRHCPCVYQVEQADQLRADWLSGADAVGITAGTSTPDNVVDQIERGLYELAEQLTEISTTWNADAQQEHEELVPAGAGA